MIKHYNEYICSMNITGKLSCVLAVAIVAVMLVFNSSCKSNKKEDTATTTPTDTAAQFNLQPSSTLTLPHADSAVIPELTLVYRD